MQFDPRGEFAGAVVELHPVVVDVPDEPDHVVDLVAVVLHAVAHEPAGREGHLAVLHVEARPREHRDVPRVVVVHVSDDHILHGAGIDAEGCQAVRHGLHDLPAALAGGLRAEPGVDQDRPAAALDHPHVVVERHRHVVLVAADEVVPRAPVEVRVADGRDFPEVVAHRVFPFVVVVRTMSPRPCPARRRPRGRSGRSRRPPARRSRSRPAAAPRGSRRATRRCAARRRCGSSVRAGG